MKRGYSKDFTPRSELPAVRRKEQAGYGRYLLDKIPATLWADAKAKAKREGISMRALMLGWLKEWVRTGEEERGR